jgi:hypothetical protein
MKPRVFGRFRRNKGASSRPHCARSGLFALFGPLNWPLIPSVSSESSQRGAIKAGRKRQKLRRPCAPENQSRVHGLQFTVASDARVEISQWHLAFGAWLLGIRSYRPCVRKTMRQSPISGTQSTNASVPARKYFTNLMPFCTKSGKTKKGGIDRIYEGAKVDISQTVVFNERTRCTLGCPQANFGREGS